MVNMIWLRVSFLSACVSNPGIVIYTCNQHLGGRDGESGLPGHHEFKTSLGFVIPCLKTSKREKEMEKGEEGEEELSPPSFQGG